MSSESERSTVILFILIALLFVVLAIISVSKIGIGFYETTAGEWLVGIGTSLLAFYTWRLALTEIREGEKNRELQAIDNDLREIYTVIRKMFHWHPKESGSVILSKYVKEQLDEVIETYSYRIPDEIVTYWEKNIRGAKPFIERISDTDAIFNYKIDSTFQVLIEEQYEEKRQRYKELTSSED